MIISLEEARVLLGEDGKGLTDEALTNLINDFDGIARAYILAYKRGEIKIPVHAERLNDDDARLVGEYFEILSDIEASSNPTPLKRL